MAFTLLSVSFKKWKKVILKTENTAIKVKFYLSEKISFSIHLLLYILNTFNDYKSNIGSPRWNWFLLFTVMINNSGHYRMVGRPCLTPNGCGHAYKSIWELTTVLLPRCYIGILYYIIGALALTYASSWNINNCSIAKCLISLHSMTSSATTTLLSANILSYYDK